MGTSSHPKGARPGSRPPGELPAPELSRVRRVSLIRREVREYLSPSALEVLFAHADVVVEGSKDLDERAPLGAVFASIMVTIDLQRCRELLREPVDEATAARVAELLHDTRDVRARIADLAREGLARVAGVAADDLQIHSLDLETRPEGASILIDSDAVLTAAKGG